MKTTRTKKTKEKGESKALNTGDIQNAVKGKNLFRDGALIGEVIAIRRTTGKDATYSLLVRYGGTHFSDVTIGPRKVLEELAKNGSAACCDAEGRIVRTFAVKERKR